jgi:two-component system phosphate regulon response regulator PhoB
MGRRPVLIVEDEEKIRDLIAFNLDTDGFTPIHASCGEKALDILGRKPVDCVLLDVMLPGIDGLETLRRIRANRALGSVPVIMLTAKSEDADIVSALELGAADYVTKPFSPKVLAARVRRALRMNEDEQGLPRTISAHGIVIDEVRHRVSLDGRPIDLSLTEFGILRLLGSEPGRVFSRDHIISAVKGDGYAVTTRAVDVQVLGLRRKLGDKANLVETVRGVGYRLREDTP